MSRPVGIIVAIAAAGFGYEVTRSLPIPGWITATVLTCTGLAVVAVAWRLLAGHESRAEREARARLREAEDRLFGGSPR